MSRKRLMSTKTVYSTKAEKYAKYRWNYASHAIETITEVTKLSQKSIVADIGAGTGILTKHFLNQVQRIYAIEPNLELRHFLKDALGCFPSVSIMGSSAENTGLRNNSVDLITVAQAIHWFEPE